MNHWEHVHYNEATVVDLHSHPSLKASLFHRNLSIDNKRKFLMKLLGRAFWPATTRTDFPKLEQGGVDTLLSTVYIPEQGWLNDLPIMNALKYIKPGGWKKLFVPSYYDATMNSFDEMELQITQYAEAQKNPNSAFKRPVTLVKNVAQLSEAIADESIAIIHSLEGAHSLQGDECGKIMNNPSEISSAGRREVLKNLEDMHERGVAYLTIAHFYPNCCVESPCFPYPEYALKFAKWRRLMTFWDHTKGLTDLGEEIVEKMLDLGMLIDITHLTPPARARVFEIVESHGKTECVFASHLGVQGVNNDPLNLCDWELRWLADNGGTLGVIFMNYWLSPIDTKLGMKYIIQTMNHIHDTAGINTISIGTDFDGMTDPPDEITDMSELPRLTRELVSLREGGKPRYSTEDLCKILGGNALRLLRGGWRGPN